MRIDTRVLRANLERIGGPRALDTPVLASFALVLFLFTVAWDMIGRGGDPVVWSIAGLFSVLIALAFLWVCRMTVLPVAPRPPRPLLALVVFALAGVIRNLSLHNTIALFTNELVPVRPFLLTAGVAVITMSLTALATAREAEHRVILQQLIAERGRLVSMGTNFEERIAEAEREMQYQVHERLDPALDEIEALLGRERSDDAPAVQVLADAVADVVRPMSHELGGPGKDPVAIIDEAIRFPSHAWQPRKDIDVRDAIRPGMFSVFIFLAAMAYIQSAQVSSIRYVFTSVVVAGLSTLLLIALRARLPVDRPLPGNLAGNAVLLAIYVCLGVVMAGFTRLWMNMPGAGRFNRTDPGPEIVALGAAVVLIGMCVSFVAIAQRRLDLVEKDLEEVNEQLAFAVAVLRGRLWVSRRNLSWVLHGPVQSALVSAALELDRPDLQDDDRERIRSRIREASAHIDSRHTRQPNLGHAIAEITSVWDFSCTIRSTVDEALLRRLDDDHTAALALIEIVREGVSNAVRHGHASEVDISVEQVDGRFARAVITDNGDGLPAESVAGIGSAILDEVCYRWQRTGGPGGTGGTTLTADVPLQG